MRTFDESKLSSPGTFVWSTTTVDAELLVSLQFNYNKREIGKIPKYKSMVPQQLVHVDTDFCQYLRVY